MDRRTEPPTWPPDESEIPEENEIPERRRGSYGFVFFGGTCARDGLAYAAGLALSVSHRLDCGSSARRINRQPGSSPAPFGHQVLWSLEFSGRARGCALLRRSVGVGIERRALYATEIRKANHGTLTNPLFRCAIVSVPAFCHWSERSPLGPSCCNL
jgi:hypothetical protein